MHRDAPAQRHGIELLGPVPEPVSLAQANLARQSYRRW
jgi:hypothetical protein